jgi:hypothetical protein
MAQQENSSLNKTAAARKQIAFVLQPTMANVHEYNNQENKRMLYFIGI